MIWPTLTLGDHEQLDLCAPEETISNQGGISAIVFQGETSPSKDTDKENHPGYRTQNRDRKLPRTALAGVAQWIEGWPANQKVAGLSPRSGHMPRLWARSPLGGM